MSERAYGIRVATLEDTAGVTAVLTASYSSLLKEHYDAGLLARALPAMTKANPMLLQSGTYFVAEADGDGVIGCGGWTLERPGTTEIAAGQEFRGHVTNRSHTPTATVRATLPRSLRVLPLSPSSLVHVALRTVSHASPPSRPLPSRRAASSSF